MMYPSESKPAQPSEQCPNCGKWYQMGECCYSSTHRVEGEHGAFISTLYGVCSERARIHNGEAT